MNPKNITLLGLALAASLAAGAQAPGTGILSWRDGVPPALMSAPAVHDGPQNVFSDISAKREARTLPTVDAATQPHAVIAKGARSPRRADPLMIVSPPWQHTFLSGGSSTSWTAFDVNEDGNKWAMYGGYGANVKGESKDDWLISPALRLEKYRYYTLTLEVATWSPNTSETIAVAIGDECNPEAMDVELHPATQVLSHFVSGYRTLTMNFLTEEDDYYYVGIHAMTPGDGVIVYVRNFTIDEGLPPTTLKGSTGMAIDVDPDGALSATVSAVCPSTTLEGNNVSAVDRADVFRDGVLIGSINAPTPGSKMSFVDNNVPDVGYHVYSITCHSGSDTGLTATARRYVGIPLAFPPSGIKAARTDNVGEVLVTWNASDTDIDGYPLKPEHVKYYVYELQSDQIAARAASGTSLTHKAVAPGDQRFVQYAIAPITDAGMTEYYSLMNYQVAVGTPYSIPMDVDFDTKGHIVGVSMNGGAMYTVTSYNAVDGLPQAPEGDNILIFVYANPGDEATAYTGMVNIPEDAVNPCFSFFTFSQSTYSNNVVTAMANGKVLGSYCESDFDFGWQLHSFSLKDFVGQTVELSVVTTCVDNGYCFLDGLLVGELREHDLEAVSLSAPRVMSPGVSTPITLRVRNNGSKTVRNWSVEILRNGNAYATGKGVKLAPRNSVTLTLNETLTEGVLCENTYSARVILDSDELPDNDVTAEISVRLEGENWPTAILSGETDDDGTVNLTWSAPVLTSDVEAGVPVVDSFEDYRSWTQHELGFWRSRDVDGQPVGGFTAYPFPGIQSGKDPAGFFVFDYNYLKRAYGFSQTPYKPYSGDKVMATILLYYGGAQDDWLVSPRLSGDAQTVTFMARSTSNFSLNSFDIVASTTGMAVADFGEPLLSVNEAVCMWKEYSVELPEGTRYFAIHDRSEEGSMLFIDDVSYIPGEPWQDLVVEGYTLWVDGQKVNSTPFGPETLAYTIDGEIVPGVYNFVVTVDYNNGRSLPSNPYTVVVEAPEEPDALPAIVVAKPTLRAEGLTLHIANAHDSNVTVATPDGRIVRAMHCMGPNATLTLPAPGLYLVRVGDNAFKVIAR